MEGHSPSGMPGAVSAASRFGSCSCCGEKGRGQCTGLFMPTLP